MKTASGEVVAAAVAPEMVRKVKSEPPPAPVASSPSQSPALPVIATQVAVACGIHELPFHIRTLPAVPAAKSEEVEKAVGAAEAPVRFPIIVLGAWAASWVRASVPEIVERVEVAAA